tara:strand:- start:91 stop:798 length:708 start_codon:yes stop_codon:yes gene_type:complete
MYRSSLDSGSQISASPFDSSPQTQTQIQPDIPFNNTAYRQMNQNIIADNFITGFKSNNNLTAIWEALIEEGMVSGNETGLFRDIAGEFIAHIGNSTEQENPDITLKQNQSFIDLFLTRLSSDKSNNSTNNLNVDSQGKPQPLNVKDEKNQRSEDFNRRYEEMKSNFDSTNRREMPRPIDFSIPLDDDKKNVNPSDYQNLINSRKYDMPPPNRSISQDKPLLPTNGEIIGTKLNEL